MSYYVSARRVARGTEQTTCEHELLLDLWVGEFGGILSSDIFLSFRITHILSGLKVFHGSLRLDVSLEFSPLCVSFWMVSIVLASHLLIFCHEPHPVWLLLRRSCPL